MHIERERDRVERRTEVRRRRGNPHDPVIAAERRAHRVSLARNSGGRAVPSVRATPLCKTRMQRAGNGDLHVRHSRPHRLARHSGRRRGAGRRAVRTPRPRPHSAAGLASRGSPRGAGPGRRAARGRRSTRTARCSPAPSRMPARSDPADDSPSAVGGGGVARGPYSKAPWNAKRRSVDMRAGGHERSDRLRRLGR